MAKRTPSGKFRGKVTIGYDPDGKPIYKYVTAPTRRELENVKEAVREHYIFGRAIPRDQPFFSGDRAEGDKSATVSSSWQIKI